MLDDTGFEKAQSSLRTCRRDKRAVVELGLNRAPLDIPHNNQHERRVRASLRGDSLHNQPAQEPVELLWRGDLRRAGLAWILAEGKINVRGTVDEWCDDYDQLWCRLNHPDREGCVTDIV